MSPPPPGKSLLHTLTLTVSVFLVLFATRPAWAAISIDQVESTDQSKAATSITSPSVSTTSTNELLLAFVSSDANSAGVTVTGVTGAGLTWVLVQRTNVQLGTAEIWRAFASAKLSKVTVKATLSQSVAASLTVVTFAGTDTTGTNGSGAIGATGTGNADPGAPTASLVTTRNGSWVFGVGNDWDNAISRTLGPNQTMVHQYLATVEDTYWVQRQTASTPLSGTTVTINDTAPTTDRYNLSIVEVLPALATGTASTYTISGTISGAGGSGATVTLSGASSGTVTASASGAYSFSNLANGSYTVTPSNSGFTFTPTSQAVTVNGANVASVNFSTVTYTISGTISGAGGNGATVTLSGAASGTVTASATGTYTFSNLVNGSYTVTPTNSGFTFTPPNQAVTVNGTNVASVNFTSASATTYSISGTISGTGASGTTLTLGGAGTATTSANSSGNYAFSGLTNGTYSVTPSKSGYTFSPAAQSETINGANITNVNFTVSVSSPVVVSISPTSAALLTGGTQQFAATVTGTSNTAVTWSTNGGTVSTSGLYTAPATAGSFTVTATSVADTTKSASATVTVTAAGSTIFYDSFPGTTLSSAWTVIQRHGEYSQGETECNVPSMVTVNDGLTITTEAQSATCGDYFNAPSTWPYITGDIQWASFNFTYGTVSIYAKFPSYQTQLWPATWMLTAACQYTNPLTGNTGVTINGHTCPDVGNSGYAEIDMTECYGNSPSWCGFNMYNPGDVGSCNRIEYTVDTNWHLFKTVWNSAGVKQYLDGNLVVTCNSSPSTPMFLIIQTQTGGVAGTPNNSDLPATLQVQYVQVTQP